jgi:phosphatidylethanolamine/phosphatidyl-N-methylethanolamine N-methyltransferase
LDVTSSNTGFFSFLQKGISNFQQTASLLPSQQYLIAEMVRSSALKHASVAVELGPGIGTITNPMLSVMPSDGKLYTIEIDPSLEQELRNNVQDARLVPLVGGAEDTGELLKAQGEERQVDVVLSSLGMSILGHDVRERVLRSAAQVLRPGGVFIQFGYVHARYVTYTRKTGLCSFNYERALRRHFGHVRKSAAFLNIPPAWVYTATKLQPQV